MGIFQNQIPLRLAAQLGREPAGAGYNVTEIAEHAATMAHAASAIRAAVEAGKSFDAPLSVLTDRASCYGAEPVVSADPHGMCVGLRFRGGAYSNGARNLFFLA